MPRNKEFDPDAVLDRALEVFWRCGYEATSIAGLLSELGIGRASLYATYGSKHELYLRALDRYVQAREPAVLERLSQPGPVLPAVRSLVESYVQEAREDPEHRGCLVVNAAIERLPADALTARRVHGSWHTLEVALTSALARARAQGELRGDPRELARFVLVVLQGLRVLGRGDAGPGVLEAAARQTLCVLEG